MTPRAARTARKPTGRGRAGGRRGPPVLVWATVDQDHDRALITGRHCDPLVLEIAPEARWSSTGHGYVITLGQLADLCCLVTEQHVAYRERSRR